MQVRSNGVCGHIWDGYRQEDRSVGESAVRRVNQAVRAARSLPVGSIASFVNYNLRSVRVASSRFHDGYLYLGCSFANSRLSIPSASYVGKYAPPWASRL